MDDATTFLRHALATLAFRTTCVIHDAPPGFADTRAVDGAWTATETLAHMADALTWAAGLARGDGSWRPAAPQAWDHERERFYAALSQLDELAATDAIECDVAQLYQGPVADTLTHVGQLATLRRIAGSPVKGRNYFQADVAVGRTGPEQTLG